MATVEKDLSNHSLYWRKRKNQLLYREMVAVARREAPSALTALDVGAYESPLLARFDWIPTKVATDIQFHPQASAATGVQPATSVSSRLSAAAC